MDDLTLGKSITALGISVGKLFQQLMDFFPRQRLIAIICQLIETKQKFEFRSDQQTRTVNAKIKQIIVLLYGYPCE